MIAVTDPSPSSCTNLVDHEVGQKSRTETVAAVLSALLGRRLWSQAELAREVGVRTQTLHTLLGELQAGGIPITTEKQHPHIYWRVPKDRFPGGYSSNRRTCPAS